MSKNVVILSGSPRKGGNTDKLTAAFKDGAESAGKTVTLFRVADMAIAPCIACEHCFSNHGNCTQKDDMARIIEALRNADAVVWASPVYYFTISAQLKLAVDRFYALVKENTPIRRTALLMTCADGSIDIAEGAIATFKRNAIHHDWEDAGVLVVTKLHDKNDIDSRTTELEQARKLGREI